MKISLPVKLSIFIVLLFAAVIATCLLWTPVMIWWDTYKYRCSKSSPDRLKLVEKLSAGGNDSKEAIRDAILSRTLAEMVKIPGGKLQLHDQSKKSIFVPAFSISKFKVSMEDYCTFLCATDVIPPHKLKDYIPKGREREPVTNISYFDAVAYCKWLGVSLPTELQWIYAFNAGGNGNFHVCYTDRPGIPDNVRWLSEERPGKYKKENKWGIHGMYGMNWKLMEWCCDESHIVGYPQPDITTSWKLPKPKGPNSMDDVRVLLSAFSREGLFLPYVLRAWAEQDHCSEFTSFRVVYQDRK